MNPSEAAQNISVNEILMLGACVFGLLGAAYIFSRIMKPIDQRIEYYEGILRQMDEDDKARQRAVNAGVVSDPSEQERARQAGNVTPRQPPQLGSGE